MTDIKVGDTLSSKYELTAILGKGRNSVVYKGYQHFAKKTVAVKVLNLDHSKSIESLKKFNQEGKTAAKLSAHPGIVDVLDFGAAGAGQVFLVLSFVEGKTLQETIAEKTRLDVGSAIKIFKQIADAVGYMHEQKLVHRRLNPSEIMLTTASSKTGPDYKVTLIDFGDTLDLSQPRVTGGETVGATGYASPEELKGEGGDVRSDVYSVGRMLYETLAGSLPEGTLTFPAELDISEGLQNAIVKATAEAPEKRFQSMKEFSAALGNSSGGEKKDDMWGWTKKIFK